MSLAHYHLRSCGFVLARLQSYFRKATLVLEEPDRARGERSAAFGVKSPWLILLRDSVVEANNQF